ELAACRSGENADVQLSSVFTKGIRPEVAPDRMVRRHPGDGVFGIDFWHAVEFSRSGRAPTAGLPADLRGNPTNLAVGVGPVKSIGPPPRAPERRPSRPWRRPSECCTGSVPGPATSGVRSSLSDGGRALYEGRRRRVKQLAGRVRGRRAGR